MSVRRGLLVDRLMVLLTTASQMVKPVSPETILRRDRGGFELTLLGLELTNWRAEENIEESPEPSEEAFLTTSSSSTSYAHAHGNTVTVRENTRNLIRGPHTMRPVRTTGAMGRFVILMATSLSQSVVPV